MIRKLFVYDKDRDRLIYIRNSEDYPNLMYNKLLNCVDAFEVYGGCSTVFLRLKGDRLKEFAGVDLHSPGLTVYEMDSSGKRRIIKRDLKFDLGYRTFENYKPLVAAPDSDTLP